MNLLELLANKMDCPLFEANQNLTYVLEAFCDFWFQGENLTLAGFGKLCISERSARTGRDPKTGRSISIKAKKTLVCKIGRAMKLNVSNALKE